MIADYSPYTDFYFYAAFVAGQRHLVRNDAMDAAEAAEICAGLANGRFRLA